MTEVEELKLKIEHLDDKIFELELRLKNAFSFIEMMNAKKEEKDEPKNR